MVQKIKNNAEVLDLHTNKGMVFSKKMYEVHLFGQAWFNPSPKQIS